MTRRNGKTTTANPTPTEKRKRSTSIAKISRPRLGATVLPRPRLFRLLDRAKSSHPILWVTGPPGSGKTTLISSYLDSRKQKGIWYLIDSGDADPASFFYYLGLAAKQAAPRVRRPLPLLTPDRLPGLPVFTRRYFEALAARLPRPFVLVFDNYHELGADSPFHDVMREGLSQVPEGATVILISRSAPPPSLAALQANNLMAVLDWNALRFTEDETRGLVARRAPRTTSREDVRRLQTKTDGWAAGIVLMLERAKLKAGGESLTEPVSASVFDYFAGEIFSKLSRAVQDMLLRTAFLPSMTLRMAERLAGAGVGKALADLTRSNYFIEERPGAERIYRYHDLFREFLLLRARERFSAAELSQIRQRAATVLESSRRIEEAVDLYAQAGDWTAVQRMIKAQAPVLVGQGRSRTLKEWVERLPKDLVGSEPWLLYWLGICQFSYGLKGLSSFEKAFNLFQTAGDAVGTFLAWSAAVDVTGFQVRNVAALDPWIEWFDQHMKDNTRFPSLEIEAQIMASATIALLLRRPQHPQLRRCVDRARGLYAHVTDISLRTKIAISSIQYSHFTGDWASDDGKRIIDEFRKLAESPHTAPLLKIQVNLWEAMLQWLTRADLEACNRAVENGVTVAEENGVHVIDGWLLAQGVYGSLTMGALTRGAEYLEKTRIALHSGNDVDASHYQYLAACHAILIGDRRVALECAKQATDIACGLGMPFPEAGCRLVLIQALMERGQQEAVASHLVEVFRIAQGMKSLSLEQLALFAQAQIELDLSDRKQSRKAEKDAGERGLEALRRAMAIGREQGYVNHQGWRPTVMARLCATALEHGIEVDYVRDLIRKRNLVPDSPPYAIEAWPWPVKVYTLGRFWILLDDQPLSMSRRSQHGKPLALLKALLAHGGRDVAQSELTEALWPDADGDAARQAFDTTLHRLRKLLGEAAVSLTDGQLTLDPNRVWVDLWSVERLMRDLDQTLKKPSPDAEAVCTAAEKLFRLYAGPFLREESDATWAVSRRERVHGRLVALLGELGQCWERGKEWERAVACYQSGIEIDPLVEQFYQRLMLAYQTLGRRAEALSTYRRCRDALNTHLQIPPSPATEAIHQQIRGA